MGVDGPFNACLSSRRAICARKIHRLQRTYQKCSDDVSAKALICLDQTPDFAQVGLTPRPLKIAACADRSASSGGPASLLRRPLARQPLRGGDLRGRRFGGKFVALLGHEIMDESILRP